jgi:hypothetical protein
MISIVFYSSLLLNTSLFVLLLSNALSLLMDIHTRYAMGLATASFVLIAHCLSSAGSQTTRLLSMIGTISTILLLFALISAEVLELVSYEEATHSDKGKSDRKYFTNYWDWIRSAGIFR